MEEILHQLGCIKPCTSWDVYYITWWAGFLPSTVCWVSGMWTLLEAKPASSRKRSSDALLMPSSTWRLAVVTGSTNDFIKAIDSKPRFFAQSFKHFTCTPERLKVMCNIYITCNYIYIMFVYIWYVLDIIHVMICHIHLQDFTSITLKTQHFANHVDCFVGIKIKARGVSAITGDCGFMYLGKGGSNVWRTYFVTWAIRCLYIVWMIFRIWHQHFTA